MYRIFDVAIDEKGHFLSEDWLFCRRWTGLGGDIWAHGKVLINHIGHDEFTGDLSKMPDFARNEHVPGGGVLNDAIDMAARGQKATVNG